MRITINTLEGITPKSLLEDICSQESYLRYLVDNESALRYVGLHLDKLKHDIALGKIGQKKAYSMAMERAKMVANDYHRWNTVMSFPQEIPSKKILEETGVPETTVRCWRNGTRKPESISDNYLSRKPRRDLSADEVLNNLDKQIRSLIENNKIKKPEENGSQTLQDIIYLHSNYIDGRLIRMLNAVGTPFYDALIMIYNEIPLREGKEPLRIKEFGNMPLKKYMFYEKIPGKFDDVKDRIEFMDMFYDLVKETDLGKRGYFKSTFNLFNRSVDHLIDKMGELYGIRSYWPAIIEIGKLTWKNLKQMKERCPNLPLVRSGVVRIRNKIMYELHVRYPESQGSYAALGRRYDITRARAEQIVDPYGKRTKYRKEYKQRYRTHRT